MTQRRWVTGALCALVMTCATARAFAGGPSPVTRTEEGYVVEVQEGDLVLDVGQAQQLRVGERVQLWRPLSIRHPVTKKKVEDRFLIGELEIVQVRPSMSLARSVGELARQPVAGDVVIVPRLAEARAHEAVASEAPPDRAAASAGAAPSESSPDVGAAPGGGPVDDETRAALALFLGMRGNSRERRAIAYERFAAAHPASPFADFFREEASALRGAERAEEARPTLRNAPRRIQARAGEPLTIALEIARAQGAVLHVRNLEDPSYVTLPMTRVSPDYYAVTVPAGRILAPSVEIFVEAVATDGTAAPVFGLPRSPLDVEVRARPAAEVEAPLRTTVKLWTDYADYNRFRGDDYAWQTEGELGLRLGDLGARALRSGFGIYRGEGGSVQDLDERGLTPRKVGLTYGYLEGELAAAHAFSFVPRFVVGLGDDGVAGGGQLLLRIGNDRETNLLFGGELLGTVGVRGIAQLELAVFDRFPILFRTEVANQPAGASPSEGDVAGEGPRALESTDIGARGIVELGFRATDALVLRARGSFQGRTIEHAGPGFGGGVEYSW